MELNFKINANRTVNVAGHNKFETPIKHPSRTLSEHVISYVVEGGWVLSIGKEQIHARPGDIFIQPASIPHVGLKDCPRGTHTLFVHFSAESEDTYEVSSPMPPTPYTITTNNFINAKNNADIKKTLLKIMDEHAKGNHVNASSYLNILLWELSEMSRTDGSPYNLAMNIKKIIASHIDENLSNQEIAKRLNVSLRTAETIFKNYVGTTMHRYQLLQKIERAKFYLAYYPEMKIVDIAFTLGFYDEYHFSRHFKKLSGFSPSGYRKHLQNKVT